MADHLTIGGEVIHKGERKRIFLDAAKLYDFTEMNVPIEVIRGKEDGPILFVSGAVHGDEINGVEIVRRLLTKRSLNNIRGTLIAVPIVNVFGFNTNSRYLPDRRDLNRSFPGSPTGSLTAQLAHIFMTEILEHCTHGIDFHTAAINRTNLPQIRACLDVPEILDMAKAFQTPVILHSPVREGSLREAALRQHIPTLLFEGGEPLRFNEKVIRAGVQGTMNVMRAINMLPALKSAPVLKDIFIAESSYWLRAPHSGILSIKKKIGQRVIKDQVLGVISDPFGLNKHEIIAKGGGIIIGAATLPLFNRGDAVFHVATFEDASAVAENVDIFTEPFVDRFG